MKNIVYSINIHDLGCLQEIITVAVLTVTSDKLIRVQREIYYCLHSYQETNSTYNEAYRKHLEAFFSIF
jgi:hypothetical protein